MGIQLIPGKSEHSTPRRRGPGANLSQHAMVIQENPFPIAMNDGQDEAQKGILATDLSSG